MVITERDGLWTLNTMPWGLPPAIFADAKRSRAHRATLFPRELRADAGILVDPAELDRCLIVLESFAYPDGTVRQRSRAWAGLWDRPLVGWAGLSAPGDRGCAGLLVAANPLLARVSGHMPLLIHPDDHGAWLNGSATLVSLSGIVDEEAFYLERTDEHWSTGASMDDKR